MMDIRGQTTVSSSPLPKPATKIPTPPTLRRQLASVNVRTLTTDDIAALVYDFRQMYDRSYSYFRKAEKRRAALRKVLIREQQQRADAGNTQAQDILNSEDAITAILDKSCPNDSEWQGYVAEQQFAERLALLIKARIELEIKLIEMAKGRTA